MITSIRFSRGFQMSKF